MRRIYPTVVAAAAALSAFQVLPTISQEDDPVIEEKPLSQLVKQLRSENRGLQLKASQTLSKAPAELHAQIVPLVIPVLKSERENDKFVAAQILGNYGPPARVAVPDLLPMLQGTQYERNRAAAAKALGQIFKDAEPSEEVDKVTAALVKAFTDKYSDVRREAVTACGMIGPSAKACLPDLVPRFDDTEWLKDSECFLVRKATAWTCGRIGPPAAVHIDRLIAKLHAEGSRASEFVEAIGGIGAVHDNVVPNIVDVMERQDRGIGWQVQGYEALEKFGAKSAPAVPLLARFLKEHRLHPHCTVAAIRVLKAVGPEAREAVPVLQTYHEIKQYRSWDQNFRATTAEELQQMRQLSREAVEAITGKKPDAAGGDAGKK
jgi:hypothetical protein